MSTNDTTIAGVPDPGRIQSDLEGGRSTGVTDLLPIAQTVKEYLASHPSNHTVDHISEAIGENPDTVREVLDQWKLDPDDVYGVVHVGPGMGGPWIK